jgi:hypothetical protein
VEKMTEKTKLVEDVEIGDRIKQEDNTFSEVESVCHNYRTKEVGVKLKGKEQETIPMGMIVWIMNNIT